MRLVVAEPTILIVLERLQPTKDLLHRHLPAGADLDLLVKALEFGGARAFETKQHHIRRGK